ncbi:golgin subfamily A member 6-like protein 22 [Paramacrobiotus metropolitanus]|uniref:golgin subfamily A member 6-like protein 22 n=1 Tax=Paramacrobiotus metropolitanus TaxID=2943436 RepID=UPI0024461A30|nr:golgin subfamily A member 6-like protein 22 [Paramacrobiotus metropolitanus]XP_055351086.1 golgin subfamily A member 6-like protein 22 [Paramacrobiotus metropolitanus]XP_055351088.1 golgin subfamily A member 6-like protein 22 [Paramacrobiotus metropolitanus]XP_055351089.1 golgin subfamily A member 6-like protein 22 [Paramacrobiotus metropolitanus]XP_055351090.1 golgin subfamily A member 6-like protein 22 [Paramacrobiotus metropolitanus]XP_055351091.1 golgin subfamily A member 6-like protein
MPKPKKGKAAKLPPWVRLWRRNAAAQTFLEDTANFEWKQAARAFNQVLIQHRPHLRRVRRRELQEEIRQEAQRIQQQIAHRDDTLEFLMDDMREAFEQEELLSQRHTAALQRLTEIHGDLKRFLEEEYYGNLRTLMAELCAKTNMLAEQNDNEMKKIDLMLKVMDEEWGEEETERRTKFLTAVDEIRNRIMEEKQMLRITMEHTISDLYQQMEDEYTKYKNKTEEKLIRYQELRAKDETNSKEVKYQITRINMLSKMVATKKAKFSAYQEKSDIKMQYWDELKNRLKAATGVVKHRIRHGNDRFLNEYKDMTAQFQAVHDQLLKLEKTGVRLVRHALAAHRMQHPDDKLYASVEKRMDDLDKEKPKNDAAKAPQLDVNKNIEEIFMLEPFIMNTAHMEVKNIVRRHENRQLKAHNQRLEKLVNEYVRAKTIDDTSLANKYDNPLLSIKGPTYVVVDRPETFRLSPKPMGR